MEPTTTREAAGSPLKATSDATAAPAKALSLLANRDFRLLWGGQAISNIGDFVFDTTLVIWVASDVARGQSWAPLAVSGVLVAAALPIFLVGPLAGVFVDRADKRRMMLAMDALRAALILLLIAGTGIFPLPFVAGARLSTTAQLVAIYSVVFLASACAQFFSPARSTLLRDIVDVPHRAQSASLAQMTQALANIIGPPLAAPLLISFGVQWALLINACSFLLSFAAILPIRPPPIASAAPTQRASYMREWAQGARFFLGSRVLTTVGIGLVLVSLGAGALNALELFFVIQNLHASATIFGLLGATFAVGTIVGALLGGAVVQRIGLARSVSLSLLALGLLLLVWSRTTSVPVALAVLFFLGIPQATLNVAVGPLVLLVTPREYIGRVFSIINPMSTAAMLLSIGLAGYLASNLLLHFHTTLGGIPLGPIDTIFTVAGGLVLLGGVYTLLRLRGVDVTQPLTATSAA